MTLQPFAPAALPAFFATTASADFSPALPEEISPGKVQNLSPRAARLYRLRLDDLWASLFRASLPPAPGLTASSCSYGRRFATRFFQLHLAVTPCGSLRLPSSAPVGSFHPTRFCPCWAHWCRPPGLHEPSASSAARTEAPEHPDRRRARVCLERHAKQPRSHSLFNPGYPEASAGLRLSRKSRHRGMMADPDGNSVLTLIAFVLSLNILTIRHYGFILRHE